MCGTRSWAVSVPAPIPYSAPVPAPIPILAPNSAPALIPNSAPALIPILVPAPYSALALVPALHSDLARGAVRDRRGSVPRRARRHPRGGAAAGHGIPPRCGYAVARAAATGGTGRA